MKYLIIIFCFSIVSCKTSQAQNTKTDCSSYNIVSSNQISWSERLIDNKFQKTYKEVRFCTHHPVYTSKIIYDEYGKWDSVIKIETKPSILIWNNLNIEGFNDSINIATSSYNDLFSSIMIFDNEGNDLLLNESKDRTYLIKFFINKMNERAKPRKTSFWKTYLKEMRQN